MKITSVNVDKFTIPKTITVNDIALDLTNIPLLGDISDKSVSQLNKQKLSFTVEGISYKHKFEKYGEQKIWTPLYLIAIRTHMLQYYSVNKLSVTSLNLSARNIPYEYINILANHISIAQDNISDDNNSYYLDVTNESSSTSKYVFTTDILNKKTNKPLRCNKCVFIVLPRSTFIKAEFEIIQKKTNIITSFGYDPSEFDDKTKVTITNNGEIDIVKSWNNSVDEILEKLELVSEIVKNNCEINKHNMNIISYLIKLNGEYENISQLIVDNIQRMSNNIISHVSVNSTINNDVKIQLNLFVEPKIYNDDVKYKTYYEPLIFDSINIVRNNINALKIKI